MSSLRVIRNRLDKIEQTRQVNLPMLILWQEGHAGDDPDIQQQADIARAAGRQVLILDWDS